MRSVHFHLLIVTLCAYLLHDYEYECPMEGVSTHHRAGGYCLMQVYVLYKRKSFHGFGYAVGAAIAGFIGLSVPQS